MIATKPISEMLMQEIPKQSTWPEVKELMQLNHWLMVQYGEWTDKGFVEWAPCQ